MNSVRPDYKVTGLKEERPPIQIEGDKIEINFSLPISQVACLGFYENVIRSALDTETNIAFISTEERFQRCFVNWARKTFKNREFSPEELNLDSLVTTIWTKSRVCLLGHCILFDKKEELADEQKWQGLADMCSQFSNWKGYNGKWFTIRQLNLFIDSLEEIAKTKVTLKV